MTADDTRRRLLWHGFFILLLALLGGAAIPLLRNPRMALSAHLAGLFAGVFVIFVGLVWRELNLSSRFALILFWLALYASYVNWGSVFLAAVFGASRLLPIAGAGYTAAAWKENIVSIGLISNALAAVICCALLLWGLRGRSSI